MFNVAIFYDLENLLKGYSFSQELITNLSLREILKAMNLERLGKIALQRAYANWSDPRLGSLREEINELGIEPIQVFGFSRDQKKNAADIQLAIDAIDIAHIRPALENYVIVSGDGGFASLAKKLHEYGKTVIGCAYKNTSNRIFKAVCDEFISIPDPEMQNQERQEAKKEITSGIRSQVNDPIVVRLIPKIRELVKNKSEDGIAVTKAVLRLFAQESSQTMKEGGIYLSTIREALKYAIPGFQQSQFGFPKFLEFLQYVCQDTPLCLIRDNSSVVLTLKNSIPPGVEVLPALEGPYLHSAQHYRSILATGSPRFPLLSPTAVEKTAEWIVQNPLKQVLFVDAVDNAVAALSPEIDVETVKSSVVCFVSAGLFVQNPDNVSVSEQLLTLKDDYDTVAKIMSALHNAVYNKLVNFISPLNDEIVAEILPKRTSDGNALKSSDEKNKLSLPSPQVSLANSDPLEIDWGRFYELAQDGKWIQILTIAKGLLNAKGLKELRPVVPSIQKGGLVIAGATNWAAKNLDERFYRIKPFAILASSQLQATLWGQTKEGIFVGVPNFGHLGFQDPNGEVSHLANLLGISIPLWEGGCDNLISQNKTLELGDNFRSLVKKSGA